MRFGSAARMSDLVRTRARAFLCAAMNGRSAAGIVRTAAEGIGAVKESLLRIRSAVQAGREDLVRGAIAELRDLTGAVRFGNLRLLDGSCALDVRACDAGLRRVTPIGVRLNPVAERTDFRLDLMASGPDVVVGVWGASFQGDGRRVAVSTPGFRGLVYFEPGASPGVYRFRIQRSGILLQLEPRGGPVTVGIPSLTPESLGVGVEGGGLHVIERALDEVGEVAACLAGMTAEVLRPAQRTNEVALENLAAAESWLPDLDLKESASA